MSRQPKPFSLGMLSLLCSAVIATLHFAIPREKVKDAGDLSVVSGHLKSYDFWRNARAHDNVIRLSEYPAVFVIPGDCLKDFSRATFEAHLHTGDVLRVSIPKVSENNLTSHQQVLIFSVSTRTATYLDEKDSIPSYNTPALLLMSAVFFLGGLAFIIWSRLKPNPPPPPLKYLE